MTNPIHRTEVIGDCTVCFVNNEAVVSVYCVRADMTSKPVYVGSTNRLLRDRMRSHMKDARDGSQLPFHAWLRGRSSFSVEVLERTDEASRHICEQRWAATFDGLLNVTDGGKGMSGYRFSGTDHARKIGQKITRGASFACEKCNASFWRKPREIRLGHNKFCSRQCYHAAQRGVPKARHLKVA